MFKLETQNDVIQRQAIERRKKLDNERKMRIFDPKTRLLGIDVKALEEQIKIKKEQADLEAAHNQLVETGRLLAHLDFETQEGKRNHQKLLDDFRLENQKKEQQRDFDLSDPKSLKNDRPARISDTDERLIHQSNLQKFDGEDLEKSNRVHLQQRQMRNWVNQSIFERNEKKRREQEENKQFNDYQNNIAAKARELNAATQQARLDKAIYDTQINLKLSETKRLKDKNEKIIRYQDDVQDIVNQVTGELLTENPSANTSNGKIRVDLFKGFSEELTKQIHTVQEGQRGNNIDHKLAAKKLDQEWADKQEIAVRTALLMEREIAEKRRQEAIKIRLENEKLALEERQRKKNSHLQAFSNTPQQSYFDQFNSTSR